MDVSVVFPCRDEGDVVGRCVTAAAEALTDLNSKSEIIVCDNGSIDSSAMRARAAGAIVVYQPIKGYGKACLAGMNAAQGKVIVMMDCDGTYAPGELGSLIKPILSGGADLVIGSRFRGNLTHGSMPFLNRTVGNPLLTYLVRKASGLPITDAQSGMRAISRDAYRKLTLVARGPEFTNEILIEAAKADLRVAEVSISYSPRIGKSKLRRWQAGLRHIHYLVKSSTLNFSM